MKIALHHEALDRKLFASGAVWAANYLLQNKENLPYGIHNFEDITSQLINSEE